MATRSDQPSLALNPRVQQQQSPQQQQRARAKSGFSFRSSLSRINPTSASKVVNLHESHEEKESRRLQSKANPSMAMIEDQPTAVASNIRATLAPIRSIQHRDIHGNPILEPDRSNPTRSRWERPLDTIRSFEAAIDGGSVRKSYAHSAKNINRRSSEFGGTQVVYDEKPRYRPASHCGGASPSLMDGRPHHPRPASYLNSFDGVGPSNGYYPNRARYPRKALDPQLNGGHAIYPVPGIQRSYETVTSASASASSADPHYSTDPSSENSSVDRIAPFTSFKEPGEGYSFENGYGNSNSHHMIQGMPDHATVPRQMKGFLPGTSQSSQKQAPRRVPIKLGTSNGDVGMPAVTTEAQPPHEKRKSWIMRRFSRVT